MSNGRLKKSFNAPSPDEIGEFLDAAGDGDNTIVRAFLKDYPSFIKAKEGVNGWTALMMAAMRDHKDTINLLLKHGANIEERDHKGRTALMLTAMCDDGSDMALFLLKKGADFGAKSDCGATALKYAISFAPKTMVAILEEWPEKEKQRLAKEHAKWLADTDCAKGLNRPLPAPRPFRAPRG